MAVVMNLYKGCKIVDKAALSDRQQENWVILQLNLDGPVPNLSRLAEDAVCCGGFIPTTVRCWP